MGGGVGGPGSRTTDYNSGQTTETHHAAAHRQVADSGAAPVSPSQVDMFQNDAAKGQAAPLGKSFNAFAKTAGDDGISKLTQAEVKTLVSDPRTLKTDAGKEKLALSLLEPDRGAGFNAHATQQVHDQFGLSAKELYHALPGNKRAEFITRFGAELTNLDDKMDIAKSAANSPNIPPEALRGLFVSTMPNKRAVNEMADAMLTNGASMKDVLHAAGPGADKFIASHHFDKRAAEPQHKTEANKLLHEASKYGLDANDVKLYTMGGHSPKVDAFIAESRDAGAPGVLQTVTDMNALRDQLKYSD